MEAIAQAGGALLLTEVEDPKDKLIMFTGIERAKFRRPVVPGDQLRIEVELKNWRARPRMIAVRMEGIVYVGAKRVAEAVVSCQLVETARGRGGSDGAGARTRTNRNKAPVWRNVRSQPVPRSLDSTREIFRGRFIPPRSLIPARKSILPAKSVRIA